MPSAEGRRRSPAFASSPAREIFSSTSAVLDEYFGYETLKTVVRQPLVLTDTLGKFDVLVNCKGGGFTGQAGAIRHGIARALVKADVELKPAIKKAGYLTRDPRMKERKKYGLKAARRAPQFSKR